MRNNYIEVAPFGDADSIRGRYATLICKIRRRSK